MLGCLPVFLQSSQEYSRWWDVEYSLCWDVCQSSYNPLKSTVGGGMLSIVCVGMCASLLTILSRVQSVVGC